MHICLLDNGGIAFVPFDQEKKAIRGMYSLHNDTMHIAGIPNNAEVIFKITHRELAEALAAFITKKDEPHWKEQVDAVIAAAKIRGGNGKVDAIKRIRELTGLQLKESLGLYKEHYE